MRFLVVESPPTINDRGSSDEERSRSDSDLLSALNSRGQGNTERQGRARGHVHRPSSGRQSAPQPIDNKVWLDTPLDPGQQVTSHANRPVLHQHFPHRKVVDICRGERGSDPFRCGRDQAIGLVQRHTVLHERATPHARLHALRNT